MHTFGQELKGATLYPFSDLYFLLQNPVEQPQKNIYPNNFTDLLTAAHLALCLQLPLKKTKNAGF